MKQKTWIKYSYGEITGGGTTSSNGIHEHTCFYPTNMKPEQFDSDAKVQLFNTIEQNKPEGAEIQRIHANIMETHDGTELAVTVLSTKSLNFQRDFQKIGEKYNDWLGKMMSESVEEGKPQQAEEEPPQQVKENPRADHGAEKGFVVYAGDMPLTTRIADSDRAATAYNMMLALADEKTDVSDPVCSMNGKDVHLTPEILHVKDEDGNSFKPLEDKEWFGSKKDNKAVKKEAFKKYKKEFIEEEGEEEWDEKMEKELQERYHVIGYDKENGSIRFTPLTWDFDKTQEMYNCITYGMNPDVTLSVVNYFEERVEVDPDNLSVVNSDGDALEREPNENWAKDLADDDAAFEDAVNALSNNEGMEL